MVEYMPLNQTESNQDEEKLTRSASKTAGYHRKWVYPVLLFILGVIVGFLLGSASSKRCAARKAWYALRLRSPMADTLDLETHIETFNGGVVTPDDSIFQQDLSPEVSMAWINLTRQQVVPVSSEYLRQRAVDPAVGAKIPERYGFGDDAYGTFSDTQHLLHCLNRVRKDVYFDYYFGSIWPDRNASDLHKAHTAHCLTVLRQFIVCESSMDLIPKVWRDGESIPVDEFVFTRKCGNYNGLWEYMNTQGIDSWEFEKIEAAPNQARVATSDEWRRLVHQTDPQPEDLGL